MKVDMHNVGKFEASIVKNAWKKEDTDGWLTLKVGILKWSWEHVGGEDNFTHEEELTFFCPDIEARIIEIKNNLDKALLLAREEQAAKIVENDAWRVENTKKEAEENG